MAPVLRNGRLTALQPENDRDSPTSLHEGSWDFTGSDSRSQDSREASEEPGSYNGEDGDDEYDDGSRTSHPSPALIEGPEAHNDILYPLRETANRVGREVEKFAEALDGYNPLQASSEIERYEMTFDLLDTYHGIALDAADRLRSHHASDAAKRNGKQWRSKMRGFKIAQDLDEEMDDADEEPQSLENATTVDDLQWWEEEARTWDLLRRLAAKHYPHPADNLALKPPPPPIHRYSSESKVYEHFLASNSKAKERDIVVRWLKETADESGEDIDDLVRDLQQNAERGDIIAHGWLHTKAAIKNQKRIHSWPHALDPSSQEVQKALVNNSKTESLVTQLDPDAPSRQGKKLEVQDQYFERAIWLGCFELLRRGKSMEDIKEWCRDRTEIWRAVSMSGLPHGGWSAENSTDDTPSCTSTLLWRRVCYAVGRREIDDKYETAVYGILSGDLMSMMPACTTWNDRLFAHYSSILRSSFEAYVLQHKSLQADTAIINSFKTFDAIQFHGGDTDRLNHAVIVTLRTKPEIREEAKKPLKTIQGNIIANIFGEFLYNQGLCLAKDANQDAVSMLIPPPPEEEPDNLAFGNFLTADDHDGIRVMAHMYLIYDSLGLSYDTPQARFLVENSLVAYINFLRLSGKEELIPLYAAQLDESRLYDVLSRSLIDVTDTEQRMTLIKLMKDLGLDVQRFVTTQTQNILDDFPESPGDYPAEGKFLILESLSEDQPMSRKVKSKFMDDELARSDILLIRSFEWHLLVDGLWSATFRTGALLYKRFYRNMHLSAAKALAENMSSDEICVNKTNSILGDAFTLADMEIEEDYDEVMDEEEELRAHRGRLLRKHMLLEAKSYRELEHLTLALYHIEDAATHIDMLSIHKNPKMRKDVRQGLHAVLADLRHQMGMILQKDWLKTSQVEEPEFPLIRSAYLPELLLAFDNILHVSGSILSRDNLLECINLATIIASEDSDLSELFMKKGRIQELVETFAHDSTSLLKATGPGKGKGTLGKKLRGLGWRREVWDINPNDKVEDQ